MFNQASKRNRRICGGCLRYDRLHGGCPRGRSCCSHHHHHLHYHHHQGLINKLGPSAGNEGKS